MRPQLRLAYPDRPGASVTFPTRDARALAAELARRIRGDVRFDEGSRALYATDASNYRQVPIGVVLPRDAADVVEALAVCRRFGAPVLPRGGGTSLAGQCCNVAVTMDMSRYMGRVLEIDARRRRARVEPGAVLDTLRKAAGEHGLTFGPDPATHNRCTIGGMIGNNSCGVHSVMAEFYGPGSRMSDNVEALDVLTYDGLRLRVGATPPDELRSLIDSGGRRGEIYAHLSALADRYAPLIRSRFPAIPRRVSGFNLDDLLPEKGFHVARALVGSEGTCAMVLEAELTLIQAPRARSLAVLGYDDVFTAGDDVPRIRELRPIGLEGLDDRLVRYARQKDLHAEYLELLPHGSGWLLVEFGGDTVDEAQDRARALVDALRRGRGAPVVKILQDPTEAENVWKIRESGLGATAFVPGSPDTWPGWEDSAVPPDRIGDYLRGLRTLFDRYQYDAALYGHFGQGCVHTRIPFELRTTEGIAKYRAFVEEAADLVLQHGGSLSGEHGDGQARGELLPKMFGPDLVEAFREFKRIWDPDWKMNPGKVVTPDPIVANLRLGADYHPPELRTHFAFPDDGGSFARATLRCVGVGACRKTEGGTMCPSYMATRDEMHTTRGRAHLLFEMLNGEPVRGGWRDPHVKAALDLCLACKGCKHECPVNVDMATYKAEFLAHYFDGRLRPAFAYATGLVHRSARLASLAPAVANLIMHAPGWRHLVKAAVGVAPQRDLPAFAPETFQQWFRRRGPRGQGPPVIVWPDTFNNYFYPEVGRAAVEALEYLGFRAEVPTSGVCCGRPLYDHGMLAQAKQQLRQILDALRSPIAAGVPIVGLEPSCVSVFRDELPNLLPQDTDARHLSQQVFTLGQFLAEKRPGLKLPHLARHALLHGHCHQKALIGLDEEKQVLSGLGISFEVPDSGCCGMAGAFGYAREHYHVSMSIGERVLLPAVRSASLSTLIIADGFSCREQIAHATNRRALHLAQVIAMALGRRGGEVPQMYPERCFMMVDSAKPASALLKVGLVVGAVLGGLAATKYVSSRG